MPLLLLSLRLHVQSPTCSSRSSSTSVSCTRRCWWSSSNFPLIPPPLLPRLVCILPVAPPEALSPGNQPWIPSQAHTKLQATLTHCTPKSRRLRPTPTAPTLSVSPGWDQHQIVWIRQNILQLACCGSNPAMYTSVLITYSVVTHNSIIH